MLMGVGNLTELTDADTHRHHHDPDGHGLRAGDPQHPGGPGQPALPAGGRARPSWRAGSCMPPRPTAACRRATTRACWRCATGARSPTARPRSRRAAAEVGDANWRIEVAEDGIHVYNRDGHHVAARPVRPVPAARASSRTAAHAFYLGVELARAQIAHQLGKRYVQDNELRWGVAVPPPAEDRLHFVQAGQHACDAPRSAGRQES